VVTNGPIEESAKLSVASCVTASSPGSSTPALSGRKRRDARQRRLLSSGAAAIARMAPIGAVKKRNQSSHCHQSHLVVPLRNRS